jgi:steroid 5-alpha reductase family enzyme
MLSTILFLIITIIVVPVMSFYYGTPLNALQSEILSTMGISVSIVAAYCFLVGELAKNNSQVDKLWSIIPIYYVWHMTLLGDFHPRMVLMSIVVTIWGIRLTYNFARRGAYQWRFWAGEEDYRWEILRNKPGFNNRFVWMIFNLFFISAYQNVLIFLFTVPILTVLYSNAPQAITTVDYVLSFFFILCVVLEFIADQQQYDYQTEKHRRIKAGEDLGEYKKGFISTGLWGIVRHPNYAMEQSIWVIFYLFSVVSTGEWINWSMPGCLLLLVLFKGSSDFSESISAEKYPEYKNYQKSVPRFIPFTKFSKND